MLTITSPETRSTPQVRITADSRRADFTTTSKGIIIGGSWLRKPTAWDAQAISGPHRKTFAQRVRAMVKGGAI